MDLDDFKNSLSQLSQNAQEAITILASSSTTISMSQISDTFSVFSNEILNLVTDSSLKNLLAVVEAIAAQLSVIVESPWTNIPADSIVTIPEETIESIQSTITHLDEEQQATCQEFIQSHAQEFQKRKMTLSDALALLTLLVAFLTLLVTIFFGILQLLPDQQLEKIIEQNDTLIAQNGIIIQNQTELESVLHDLGNGIHLLADVVDSIRDGNEDIDDLSKVQGRADSDDTKQQNAN